MKNLQKRRCSVVLILAIMLSVGILPVPASAATRPSVTLTSQKLIVNGKEVKTEIYNIDGSNYFKLRDIAMLLNGTESQFSINTRDHYGKLVIDLQPGEAYTPVGGELVTGADKSASTVMNEQLMTINGESRRFTINLYNIGGNNFFKLRELADMFFFDVDYDSKTNAVIVSTKSLATAKVVGWKDSFTGYPGYEGEKEGYWYDSIQMKYRLGNGGATRVVPYSVAERAQRIVEAEEAAGIDRNKSVFDWTDEDWEKYNKAHAEIEAAWNAEHAFDGFDHDWRYWYPAYD